MIRVKGQRMLPVAHKIPYWQIAVVVALAALWLAVATLLVLTRGDPESFLRVALAGYARRDAFNDLNRVSFLFLVAHSCLLVVAIAAVRCRRSDVLAVLLLGPAIALPICYLGQEWSVPEWFFVPAVCMICWMVSTTVGGSYWIVSKDGKRCHP